jgi:hypothetical protein
MNVMARVRNSWWPLGPAVVVAPAVVIVAVVLVMTWPMLGWPYPLWIQVSAQFHQQFTWAGLVAGTAACWYATQLHPADRIWVQPRAPRLGAAIVTRHLTVLVAWYVGAYLVALVPLVVATLGGPIRGRGGLIHQPSRGNLHPLQCRNTRHGGQSAGKASRDHASCGARLDTAPRSAATTLPPEDLALLLVLQNRLDQCLDQHRDTDGVGDTSHAFYFPDLIIASQLIKVSWPAGSAFAPSDATAALLSKHIEPITAALESRPAKAKGAYRRISDLWAAPDNAAQCGALLLTADAVLGDRDPASLRERVQPLIQAAYDRAPARIYHAIRGADFSPGMARAMIRRVFTFHHGSEQARLLVPSRDCLFTTEEIPPLLPQNWFEAHFTGFTQRMINTNSWTTRHLRRAASLKLVEMTAGTHWADSAETLGMPKGSASRTMAVLRKQIPNDTMWQEFEAAVEQIAHTLDNNPEHINYANRRRAMTTWEMSEADWKRLCAGIPKMGRMATQNPLIGTVLVWSEVTQADHLQCPSLNALRQTDAPEARRVCDRVAQLLTPSRQTAGSLELRHRLKQYATDLAARCDTGADPRSPS